MKTILAFIGCIVLCPAPFARAAEASGEARPVRVGAGDLADAVESLGKQTGVNVLYPADLLERQRTSGVEGMLTPTQAFARLLEGTSLAVTEERGALRIAQVVVDVESAPDALRSAEVPAVPLGSECHLVMEKGRIQRYCGGPESWRELESRVGFGCRKKFYASVPTGSRVARKVRREPVCASAAEWKTFDVQRTKQQSVQSFFRIDEASDSAARNNPTFRGIAPTVSAPVSAPATTPP